MQRWSYHTHNRYCDGAGEIEDVVREALARGLQRLGISSHAPLPFSPHWTVAVDQLDEYIRDVRSLQDRYSGQIDVTLGAEIDFIPDQRVADFQAEKLLSRPFQYFVASVHFLGHGYPPMQFNARQGAFRKLLDEEYGGYARSMVEDYYARVRGAVTIPKVRVVGHLDLIKRWNGNGKYFSDSEPWYRAAVDETLEAIAAGGQTVELNTSGWLKGQDEPYPATWILERCKDLGIPLTVSSDGHKPDHVTYEFSRAEASLSDLGIAPADPLEKHSTSGNDHRTQ